MKVIGLKRKKMQTPILTDHICLCIRGKSISSELLRAGTVTRLAQTDFLWGFQARAPPFCPVYSALMRAAGLQVRSTHIVSVKIAFLPLTMHPGTSHELRNVSRSSVDLAPRPQRNFRSLAPHIFRRYPGLGFARLVPPFHARSTLTHTIFSDLSLYPSTSSIYPPFDLKTSLSSRKVPLSLVSR